jgi:hypothetical protein
VLKAKQVNGSDLALFVRAAPGLELPESMKLLKSMKLVVFRMLPFAAKPSLVLYHLEMISIKQVARLYTTNTIYHLT